MNKINYLLFDKCGVYVITNLISGNRCVGASVNVYNRLHEHLHNLKNNISHNYFLQEEWNTFGEDAFNYGLLEFCDKDDLNSREQYYITSPKPEYNKSLNIHAWIGMKRSDECKNKISNTLKSKYASGEIVTYKQEHLWTTTYIYDIVNLCLAKVCKNKTSAIEFLKSKHHLSTNKVYNNRYIVSYDMINDTNELFNYVNKNTKISTCVSGKYIICEDDDLHYYKTLRECADDNNTSIHTLHHFNNATKDNPALIRNSNRKFYFSNEYISIQYEAVPLGKPMELLSGKIGEGCDANTEINTEIASHVSIAQGSGSL